MPATQVLISPKPRSDGPNTGAAASQKTEQKKVSLASHWTRLGEMAMPTRSQPTQNTRMRGAWGSTPENQDLENVSPVYCTPITSGWKCHEDRKGVRRAIHSVFGCFKIQVSLNYVRVTLMLLSYEKQCKNAMSLSIEMTKGGASPSLHTIVLHTILEQKFKGRLRRTNF